MIKLTNISKYFDERNILSNISLSIDENEFICITGESGTGKTTLLNIIGLLDKPDRGEVSLLNKKSFSRKDILEFRRNFFGYIFQDYLLIQDKTVRENINISKRYNNKIRESDINVALNKVNLSRDYLDKKVCYLSGGEQQRVAIARVMLKPYKLILADEPTGNLDHKNKKEIIQILKEIKNSGKTIICVTHDKDVSDAADRIINLSELKSMNIK